jgi:hypothetical protein
VTRVRLREAHAAEQLAAMYPRPHDHTRWADHVERVEKTIGFGKAMIDDHGWPPASIADLSAGNAAIARALAAHITGRWGHPRGVNLILGDYAPGYPIAGPIEQTIDAVDHCDLFVCTETIEHLDDPDTVLAKIQVKSQMLLLSTPLDDQGQGINPEHYWSFGFADVEEMLEAAGFTHRHGLAIQCAEGTGYQIWGAR